MFDDSGSFLLALLYLFFFVIFFMCLFWVFGDLFRSKDLGGWAKTFWIIFIIIAPFLGMLIYVIARGSGMADRAIAQQREIQEKQMEYAQQLVGPGGGATKSATEQIADAKALHDAGTINDEEFAALKAKALS